VPALIQQYLLSPCWVCWQRPACGLLLLQLLR
jgi:hypothetical protein